MNVMLWVAFLVICIIAEVITSVSLVTIWFMPGAIIAAVLAAFDTPVTLQIIVFLVTSIISLFITKKIAKSRRNAKHQKTNVDALIGRTTKLLEDCSEFKNSSVKFGDVVWTVKPLNGEVLPQNALVKIVRIEGNTLIVKKGE